MKRARILLPVAALALAACGSDSGATIDGAWARNSPAGANLGAIYFDVTVDDDDTLVSADVPDSIADHAEIHEVVAADIGSGGMDDGASEDDASEDDGEMAGSDDMDGEGQMDGEMEGTGAMRMQEMERGLPLVGGETVSLEPGGYHVMLIDLVEPLEIGDEIDLTLEFAEAGETTITVEVAETAP